MRLKVLGVLIMLVGASGFVLGNILGPDAKVVTFVCGAVALLVGYGFVRIDTLLTPVLDEMEKAKENEIEAGKGKRK